MTAAATVTDVSMRFGDHTALDGVTTAFATDAITGLLEHVVLLDAGRVLLDADAEDLRASALTVTGPADRVTAFGRQHEVLTCETLGSAGRAVVRLSGPVDAADLPAWGLTAEPTPLQQLVVALSTRPAGVPTPAGDHGATAFEEVTR